MKKLPLVLCIAICLLFCSCSKAMPEEPNYQKEEVVQDSSGADTDNKGGYTEADENSHANDADIPQSSSKAENKVCEHLAVIDKAVEATCDREGLSEGAHCSLCGEILTEQKSLPAKGHNIVVDKSVAATCSESGLSEGSHCSVCGKKIVEQKVINPTGHHYSPATYTKPETCTICGATRGSVLPKPSISIRNSSFPCYQGDIRINSATISTSYNNDGTYDVVVRMNITNMSNSTRIGGATPYLSGMEAYDGTAVTLAPRSSGNCTVTFHNITGGSYDLSF